MGCGDAAEEVLYPDPAREGGSEDGNGREERESFIEQGMEGRREQGMEAGREGWVGGRQGGLAGRVGWEGEGDDGVISESSDAGTAGSPHTALPAVCRR